MSDLMKNREVVRNLETVDLSKERLEREFNKSIDDGYNSAPTNDRYVVTQERSRGKATFPLILIGTALETKQFKKAIINSLSNVSEVGEEVSIMYKQQGKAVFLCKSRGNKETIELLNNYCLSFKYYVSKGVQKRDMTFDNLIDLDSVGANILIHEEEAEDYVPEFKKEVIRDMDNEKYQKEIEQILNKGRTVNEIDKLINPQTIRQEIKENQDIQTPLPVPVPVKTFPIMDNQNIETPTVEVNTQVEEINTKVNAW